MAADGLKEITLNCGKGVSLDNTDGTVFHVAMPEGTYTGTYILFMTSDRKYCAKMLKADKPLVITRSKITPAAIKIDKWTNNSKAPDGAISGTFTVSAEGKKVYFSKGNLYWDGSSHKFEDKQYNQNVSGHKSTFFWTNKEEYARGSEWNLDVNAPIAFFTNADEVTANLGFTANGQTGLWRTLSTAEWKYLINQNGSKWTTINGVGGIIIFCDGYSGEKGVEFTKIPKDCLFLPAAGFRYGDEGKTIVDEVGSGGSYWSSSPYSLSSSMAYDLHFNHNNVFGDYADKRYRAQPVRLVTDVK